MTSPLNDIRFLTENVWLVIRSVAGMAMRTQSQVMLVGHVHPFKNRLSNKYRRLSAFDGDLRKTDLYITGFNLHSNRSWLIQYNHPYEAELGTHVRYLQVCLSFTLVEPPYCGKRLTIIPFTFALSLSVLLTGTIRRLATISYQEHNHFPFVLHHLLLLLHL